MKTNSTSKHIKAIIHTLGLLSEGLSVLPALGGGGGLVVVGLVVVGLVVVGLVVVGLVVVGGFESVLLEFL